MQMEQGRQGVGKTVVQKVVEESRKRYEKLAGALNNDYCLSRPYHMLYP